VCGAVLASRDFKPVCTAELGYMANFDEVLRVIDSLQLTAKHKVATPVNWKHGEDVIIAGSVSDEEAKKQYPQGWKAPRHYIRVVPQPQG
jgi:alkyl hydroperoxide reductase subunit AhpC